MFKNFSQKSRYCQCLICSYLNVFTDKNVHECIQKQTLLEKQIWFLTFLLPGWKVEKLPWQTTRLSSSILKGDFTKSSVYVHSAHRNENFICSSSNTYKEHILRENIIIFFKKINIMRICFYKMMFYI